MIGSTPLAKFLKREGEGAQAKLAREVACSESHLSLVASGKKGLSPPLAKKISDATGIPLKALRPDLAKMFEAAE